MLNLEQAHRLGDRGILQSQVSAENAAPGFSAAAARFMAVRLLEDGPTSGEALVDAAIASGINPRDARAFGAAFRLLLRWGVKVVGTCPRRKGHGSSGGKVYAIQPNGGHHA